jgi:eukaryotic-like serine/threonine-protein kinase
VPVGIRQIPLAFQTGYVRGRAYLSERKATEAAAEFGRIISHRGAVGNEPIGAPAHLDLARVEALQGDKAKTRAAYQEFLALWKDTDLDMPILKRAKAEYDRFR